MPYCADAGPFFNFNKPEFSGLVSYGIYALLCQVNCHIAYVGRYVCRWFDAFTDVNVIVEAVEFWAVKINKSFPYRNVAG